MYVSQMLHFSGIKTKPFPLVHVAIFHLPHVGFNNPVPLGASACDSPYSKKKQRFFFPGVITLPILGGGSKQYKCMGEFGGISLIMLHCLGWSYNDHCLPLVISLSRGTFGR